MKRTVNRTLSTLLVLCMVLGMLPSLGLASKVNAASNIVGTFEGQDSDVFSALGFDTSKLPEGYDADTTDNPTGREKSVGTQVYELVLASYGGARINGFNENNLAETDIVDVENETTPKYKLAAGAAGDFDGDGLAGEFVYVGFNALDYKRDGKVDSALRLSVYGNNRHALKPGTNEKVLSTTVSPANSVRKDQLKDNSVKFDWAWQNLLQVTAGDYDGDGISEIAVYVPENGSARVDVYKYQKTSKSGEEDWLDMNNWSRVWSHALSKSGELVPNMVSLATGDFNRDGVDDLALSYGTVSIISEELDNPINYQGMYNDTVIASKATVLWGNKTGMLQVNAPLDLNESELGELARVSLITGDLDGDGYRELIATGQSMDELKRYRGSALRLLLGQYVLTDGNKTRTITTYIYDSSVGLVVNSSDTYKPIDGEYVTTETEVPDGDGGTTTESSTSWSGNNGFDGYYRSVPLMRTNASVIKPKGHDYTYLYLDSCLYEYNNGALSLKFALDEYNNYNMDGGTLGGSGYWGMEYEKGTFGALSPWKGSFYTEYGAASEDIWGRGNQLLVSGIFDSGSRQNSYTSTHNSGYGMLYGNGNGGFSTDAVMRKKNDENGVQGYTAVFGNVDIDTVIVEYSGVHYLTYSDPKVLAIIAAAPYYEDVDITSGYDYGWQNSTSYSTISGHGDEEHVTVDMSVGGYLGAEITGGGGMFATELGINFTFNWEESTTNTTEYTLTFETSQDQDAVAFFSIPTENYVYTIHTPNGNSGYTTTTEIISRTFTPCYQVLDLDYYESIQGNYDSLPVIRGEAITSTPGNPASYPASAGGYDVIAQWNDYPAGVSFGYGSITQEITVTKEESVRYTMGSSVDYRYGGGLNVQSDLAQAQAKINGGFQFSINPAGGWADIDLTGTVFSGTVTNMPEEFRDYGYYYSWKLFAYNYKFDDGTSIPVVSYIVGDVSEPPKLPKDFGQDFDRTTDEKNVLTWTYSGAFSKFYIYKHFDFPVGGGLQLLETIDASTASYTVKYDENGKIYKEYYYEDTNLTPYTEYKYAIQVENLGSIPPLSAPSNLLTARTKAAEGYPLMPIMESDNENDGELLVYPDKNSYLTVNTTGPNGEEADSFYSVVQYQWQKLENGAWTDLINETNMTLTFAGAGVEIEGDYRCLVNVQVKSNAQFISAYTAPVTVSHSKRSSFITDFSMTDNAAGTSVAITATVVNAHSDSGTIPAGNVIFTVIENATGKSYQFNAELNSAGVATTVVEDVLPAGIYTVEAYYCGSYIFTSCSSETIYLSQISSGYVVDAPDAAVYGDGSYAVFRKVTKQGGETVTTAMAPESVGIYLGTRYSTKDIGAIDTVVIGGQVAKNNRYSFLTEDGSMVYFESNVDGTVLYVENGFVYLKAVANGLSATGSTGKFAISEKLDANDYILRMVASDGGTAGAEFAVVPRNITLKLPTSTAYENAGKATNPSLKDLTLVKGSFASFDGDNAVFLSQEIVLQYTNTAGAVFDAGNVLKTCGYYVTTTDKGIYSVNIDEAVLQNNSQTNYKISYQSGSLSVQGSPRKVTIAARYFEGQAVGTVYAVSPTYGFTRNERADGGLIQTHATGTRLVFTAVPDNGYEVYDWYINGISQGSKANSLAHVLLNEDTVIEVQFAVKQNTLTYGTDGDAGGGTISCVDTNGNPISIPSGSILANNAHVFFVAKANEGYHFLEWRYTELGEGTVYNTDDSGKANSEFELLMPTNSCVLYAVFERDFYTFSYTDRSGNNGFTAWYMGNPGGDATAELEKVYIESGTKVKGDTVVTVEPKLGYSFDADYRYVSIGNQGVADSAAGTYSLTLTEDTEVKGNTKQNLYGITVNYNVKKASGTLIESVVADIAYSYGADGQGSFAYDNTDNCAYTIEDIRGGLLVNLTATYPSYYIRKGWTSADTVTKAVTEINYLAEQTKQGAQVVAGKAYYYTADAVDYYFIAPASGAVEWEGTDVTVYVEADTYTIAELGKNENLTLHLTEKPVFTVKLDNIENQGASYLLNSEGNFTLPEGAILVDAKGEATITEGKVVLHEGDDITLLVNVGTAKTVAYWQIKDETSGETMQTRATSLKYTIPAISGNYVFTPLFASSTYHTVTWAQITELPGVELAPLAGSISNVQTGGSFGFELFTEDWNTVEGVYANGVKFPMESGKLEAENGMTYANHNTEKEKRFVLTGINDAVELSVKFKSVGITVDGVDVSNITGNGWVYSSGTQTLTVTRSNLTVSGENTRHAYDERVATPYFQIVVEEGVAAITLQDLTLYSGGEGETRETNAITAKSKELYITLAGTNYIEYAAPKNHFSHYIGNAIYAEDYLYFVGNGALDIDLLSYEAAIYNSNAAINASNGKVYIGTEGATTGPDIKASVVYPESENGVSAVALRTRDLTLYSGSLDLSAQRNTVLVLTKLYVYGGTLNAKTTDGETAVINYGEWFIYYPHGYSLQGKHGDRNEAKVLSKIRTASAYVKEHEWSSEVRHEMHRASDWSGTLYSFNLCAFEGANASDGLNVKAEQFIKDANGYTKQLEASFTSELLGDNSDTDKLYLYFIAPYNNDPYLELTYVDDLEEHMVNLPTYKVGSYTKSSGLLVLDSRSGDADGNGTFFEFTVSGTASDLTLATVGGANISTARPLTLSTATVKALDFQGVANAKIYAEGSNYLISDTASGAILDTSTLDIYSDSGNGALTAANTGDGNPALKLDTINLYNTALTLITAGGNNALQAATEGTVPAVTYSDAIVALGELDTPTALGYGDGWQAVAGDTAADAELKRSIALAIANTGYISISRMSKEGALYPASFDGNVVMFPDINLTYNKDSGKDVYAYIIEPIANGKLYRLAQQKASTHTAARETELYIITPDGTELLLGTYDSFKTTGVAANVGLNFNLTSSETVKEVLGSLENGNYTLRVDFYDNDVTDNQKQSVETLLVIESYETWLTVDPESATIVQGESLEFTASSLYTGGMVSYEWAIADNKSESTTVTAKGNIGTVSVGKDETAPTLTLTVTSYVGSEIVGRRTVTVSVSGEGGAPIESILTIGSLDADADFGVRLAQSGAASYKFYAKFDGEDVTEGVTWSLWGAERAATDMDANGVLSLDAGENGTDGVLILTAYYKDLSTSVTLTVKKAHNVIVENVTDGNKTATMYADGETVKDAAYLAAGDSFTVSCGAPCAVFYSTDGVNYTELEGTATDMENTYMFKAPELDGGYTVAIRRIGDVNSDGLTDSMDSVKILRYDACITELTASGISVGDVNGDGEINNVDAAIILKYDSGVLDVLTW